MTDEIKRAESALIVALTSEVTEGHTLAEQIEILVSQRDNAYRAAEAHKAEADKLRVDLVSVAESTWRCGRMFTAGHAIALEDALFKGEQQ